MTLLSSCCRPLSAFVVITRLPRPPPRLVRRESHRRGNAWRSAQRRQLSSLSSRSRSRSRNNDSDADNEDDHDDDRNVLQQALQKAEERALDDFIQTKAPTWLQDFETMPFACTACGKCCLTEGQVYMDPEEIQQAANLLEVTPVEFTRKYASHMLGGPEEEEEDTISFDETSTWIRLREREGS